MGNPLLSVTVLSLVDEGTLSAMLSALSAAAIGTGLAVVTSRFLFFEVQESASVLLFVPRETGPTTRQEPALSRGG